MSDLIFMIIKLMKLFTSTVNYFDQQAFDEKFDLVLKDYENLDMAVRILKESYPVFKNPSNENVAQELAFRKIGEVIILNFI